ncbi:hypothetical protein [Kitasatospora paranensis]|uniref:Uncharacterized protein n=1 Tax=Kitasatospora paranensis TaxID=258053 RepID=A0ABW2G3U3_9ACTN
MSHRTSADHPVRRGHDPGDHLRRVAAAQMELMAEDVRRLALALHELSRREGTRRPSGPMVGPVGAVPPPVAAPDSRPDPAAA